MDLIYLSKTSLISQNFPLCSRKSFGADSRRDNKDDEISVMEDKEEKEKKPWKCLEGSNGFFIYKNMAENWCGSSPEWGESTVAMAQ